MDINTFFEGLGTELIIFILTLLIGGGIGIGVYKCKKKRVHQSQKAGNGAKQNQEVKQSDVMKINQQQESGDNSEQTQIS